MAYDSGRDVVVLYGGASGWPYSSQTWEFDLSSATWSVVNDGTAQAPNAVHGMSLTYDPDNQRMLLFGGSDNQDQELNELWSFANGGWDNDPNSVGWLVVYGGNERGTVLNDLWAFDGTGWDFANVTPNTPAGRTDQSMIYRENGAASKYEFVIYGEHLEMVDGMGHTKIYTPTASGQLAQEEDENGKITNYSYNSFDQVTQIQYAFGTADETAVNYVYDSLGRLIETTNQDGTVSKTEYDAANRVTKTTNNYLAGQPQNHQDRYNLITTYTYDSAGRLTSTTDTFGKTDLTEYDSAGRPFKRIMNYDGTTPTGQLCTSAWFNNPDPENNICSLTSYDEYGRVSSTTDALGHVSRTFYDDLGRVLGTVNHSVQITDKSQLDNCFTLPTDRDSDVCSKNEYDAMGNLIISTDTVGRKTRTLYDALNRQYGTIRNWSGTIDTESELDACLADTNLSRTSDICSKTEYDEVGNVIVTTDAVGVRSRSVYDELNRLVASIQNWGGGNVDTIVNDCRNGSLSDTRTSNICTLYGYDDAGRQTVTTNALGQQSLTVYDEASRVYISVQNWDGTTTFTDHTADCPFGTTGDSNLCSVTLYNSLGQRSQTIDPMGDVTDYTYDPTGRLLKTTRYLNGNPIETSTSYDALGKTIAQTDANGNTRTMSYDSLYRVETTASAEGVTSSSTYDALGRVTVRTDGLGHTTSTSYDDLGRTVSTTNGNGDSATTEYNILGQRTATIDAEGMRTEYEYDDLNRQVKMIVNVDGTGTQTDDANVETITEYDVLGNRIRMIDALGRTAVETTYDVLNRPIAVSNALTQTTTMSYNVLGQKVSETNPLGQQTTYLYDGLNRQTQVTYVADGDSTSYTYNARGQRLTMTDSLGTASTTYDDLGRMTAATDSLGSTLGYGYNAGGNRTSITYPDGKVVTYTYDQDNRLKTISDWTGGVATYDYDNAGRHTQTVLQNGTVMVNGYDNANRLTSRTYTDSSNNLLGSYVYTLDKVGNKTLVQEQILAPEAIEEIEAFVEQNGEVTIEAEDGTDTASTTHGWVDQSVQSGSSGSYARALPDTGQRIEAANSGGAATLDFNIDVTNPGNYTVWVRGMAPDPSGDSVHVSLNGAHQAELSGFAMQEWSWAKLDMGGGDVTVDLQSGVQSLTLSMREDGLRVDRLYLTDPAAGSGQAPTGVGPAASQQMTVTQNVIQQTVVFSYDGLYRHTQADYSGTLNATYGYSYDALGNRQTYSKTLNGTTTSTTYTYDAANRLDSTVEGLITRDYSWDAAGRQISLLQNGTQLKSYSYDQKGWMVSATVNNLVTTFSYNGNGQRLQLTVDGDTTTFVADYARGSGRILYESNSSETKYYIYGENCLGEHVTDTTNNTTEWRQYQYDGNALVRQTTDENEEVTFTWTFSPEGAVVLGEEGPVTHLACSGDAVYDFSTGLIYKDGRYYDPSDNIWLSTSTSLGLLLGLYNLRWLNKRRQRRRKSKVSKAVWFLLNLGMLTLLTACPPIEGPEPTPTETPCPDEMKLPTEVPVPTNTPTNTPAPTNTPTSTPTVTNIPTSTPTHTPTHTQTPTFTPTPNVSPQVAVTQFCNSSGTCKDDNVRQLDIDFSFMTNYFGYNPGIVKLPYHTDASELSHDNLFPWEGAAGVLTQEHKALHPNAFAAGSREFDYFTQRIIGDSFGILDTMKNRADSRRYQSANHAALTPGQYGTPPLYYNSWSVYQDFYAMAFTSIMIDYEERLHDFQFFAHQDLNDIRGVTGQTPESWGQPYDLNGYYINYSSDEPVESICCVETTGFGIDQSASKDFYIPVGLYPYVH